MEDVARKLSLEKDNGQPRELALEDIRKRDTACRRAEQETKLRDDEVLVPRRRVELPLTMQAFIPSIALPLRVRPTPTLPGAGLGRRRGRRVMTPIGRMAARRPGQRGAAGGSEERKQGGNGSDSTSESGDFATGSTRRSRGEADNSKKGLELSWRFQMKKNDGPAMCKKCNGVGRVECSWCHATGVLMLGDRLMCSIEGQSHCLACNNGEVECKACKGTGRLASWMVLDL